MFVCHNIFEFALYLLHCPRDLSWNKIMNGYIPPFRLVTRADSSDAHDDSLTMETLIEDSRDSLQQVKLRRKYIRER